MPIRFLGIQGNIAQLGPIQGIFGTRNLLGFVAVLALITFLIEYRTQSVRPGVSIASVVLAGGLAALSDSPTVLVLAVGVGLAVGALALVRHTRPERARRPAVGASAALVVVGVIVGYAARHPIIALLGAGTDFSMRVEPVEHDGRLRALPARAGLGMVRAVEPARVPVQRDQLHPRHRRTPPA